MEHPIREVLLKIMDKKDHWAWPSLTRPGLSQRQLLVHFRHEYQTYVRDFPALLARVLGQGPPKDVREALAENIYEEQTGKLSVGFAHPELFLEMMTGLGFSRAALEAVDPALEAEAVAYRDFLDRVSATPPWQLGGAVLTIFVEGSCHERKEMAGTRERRPIDVAIREHPLVRYYGCPPDKMGLVRAHHMVEGGHRHDAWRVLLTHVPHHGRLCDDVARHVEAAHRAWSTYRDGVARAMGLKKPEA